MGLIIPSVNVVMEPEFNAMIPDGISVHTTRLFLTTGTVENLEKMAEDTERAAELLSTAKVDVVAYGCTMGSLIKGIGWDRQLIARINKICRVPATTTSTAAILAFEKLGIRKVAVATPYREELNLKEKEFFEAHGIKVVNMKGLSLTGEGMHRASPEITYKLACKVNTPEADAVFISCTNFKSVTVVEDLEDRLHKFVFSSNTATFWDIIRKLGLRARIKGYGSLFEFV